MQWYNKSKRERKNWPWTQPPNKENIANAVVWCKAYSSDGRFYYHYTNTRWWFENEQDAIMFALQGF